MNKENSNIEKNNSGSGAKDEAEKPAVEEQSAGPAVKEKNRDRDSRKPQPRKKDIIPSEFVEQVVSINRITKVTKGGKKLSFSALVVVGDTKGRVGYSLSKANEVSIKQL